MAPPAGRRTTLLAGSSIVTEDDLIQFATNLPGVTSLTASADNGSPESAWGDSFFYYDPDGDVRFDQSFPFATIVVSDYDGFDSSSQLNRPNVFRLNINVGRKTFQELLGYPPAAQAEHADDVDYAALDVLLPHPVYGTQAWVSILNPDSLDEQAQALLVAAHARAADRHRPTSR